MMIVCLKFLQTVAALWQHYKQRNYEKYSKNGSNCNRDTYADGLFEKYPDQNRKNIH